MDEMRVLAGPDLFAAAHTAGNDIDRCLAFAREFGARLPPPGGGRTWNRWQLLAAAAAADLTAARVLEAHSDALAILDEAGEALPAGTWGVFAAEGPDVRVDFAEGRLRGTKPWCSLGDRLDSALVTAYVADERQLVAVDLRGPTVRAEPPQRWVARGLSGVTSTALHFDGTPGRPVGAPGWYLRRPGFAWGGIGVAACWYGGMVALAEPLRDRVRRRGSELDAMHLGAVDVAAQVARGALRSAAADVDRGISGADAAVLALRVRSVVASAAEDVLRRVGHALGPAPLAFDEPHARRAADLEIYLRQHHGERDLAALGSAVLTQPSPLDELRGDT
jgi:hypothetical protein